MSRYLFSSHDGYGLGHVRRNVLIAREILRRDAGARITLVTGVPRRPSWLDDPRLDVVSVPPLLKDHDGVYRNPGMGFHDAIGARARTFAGTVRRHRPDVVVVDRHPFGTAGELRPGLQAARAAGARVVLGLRDIIDEPGVVARELAGTGWAGLGDVFHDVLVYGQRSLCDHQREYGLPIPPAYTGWVVAPVAPAAERAVDPDLLLVSAGGGGDGAPVFQLGLGVTRLRRRWRTVIAAGPYAADWEPARDRATAGRVVLERDGGSAVRWFARAGAAVQMAGYNSTAECLAVGIRPVLVPRRAPRREQAIRAGRLACLGLADVVDEDASPAEVAWLLDQPRRIGAGALRAGGLLLDGAARAAEHLVRHAPVGAP